ncbi:catechol 2,3-dioxygenase-like lactoylglutathione lyase family enzyme [Stackebrandtia endophytica]|uniref:Catechol 2,3-dioxygenase-like lactoylglutathione lyase family enzyme n=1 Tax=Stackebrandtia endophytica TaxID=1496996 RepID=A0A543B445_9ACTN|nr:VOC family protein [Stackebrandtia endophytica]TQL79598.1 catechol 2,3-dioxygenase-like lactoylglutathione lyase family enzyme [Stackebrandtia endophytica]
MAQLDGFHHVSLTVSDLARSVAWYREVLGLTVASVREQPGLRKTMLRDSGASMTLVLVEHQDLDGDEFSEFRPGLDHLSFAVADRAALSAWRDRLDALGVEHSGVVSGSVGDLIAFRDRDNIAVELYTRV